MSTPTKFHWYNLAADLPVPLPAVLHPGTMQPVGPQDLEPLFPMSLIGQEVSTERHIEIPEPVRQVFRQWRPAPLFRARRLEQALGTPARIYYKYEGVSPAGSHKPNTAIPQAWYNQQAGIRKLTTETGAGQWGTSLSFAGALFGIEVQVFQVRVSYNQKPYRRAVMETYGATCVASPSELTQSGRAILAQPGPSRQPGHRHLRGGGAGGAARRHQVRAGFGAQPCADAPDHHRPGGHPAIGDGRRRPGRGGGLHRWRLQLCRHRLPLHRHAAARGAAKKRRIVAVEPSACPSLTRGKYAYDFGDTAHLTPLTKMHTLGSTFTPPGFHAGGLRYHGMAPMVSHCKELGLIEAVAYTSAPASPPVSPLPGPKASCPRRRPTTRSRAPSRRRCAASAKASPR
jgi:tryptophan synthase beta chain